MASVCLVAVMVVVVLQVLGEFYWQLRNEKPAAVALQAAQNYLRRLDAKQIEEETFKLRDAGFTRHLRPSEAAVAPSDYSHPRYWAPFILVG